MVYIMSSEENIFRRVREAQEEVKRLEEKSEPLIDWKNPLEKVEYLRERKRERRRELLNKMVPTRICPCCGDGPILESRSWVIKNGKAVCRTCHWKQIKKS